jgi:RNase P/RNase MRP subunit p29
MAFGIIGDVVAETYQHLVLRQFTMTDRSPNFSLEDQDKSWTPTS